MHIRPVILYSRIEILIRLWQNTCSQIPVLLLVHLSATPVGVRVFLSLAMLICSPLQNPSLYLDYLCPASTGTLNQCVALIDLYACAQGCFICTDVNFSIFSEQVPCHGMRVATQCHVCPTKAFFGSHTRYMILKILGGAEI